MQTQPSHLDTHFNEIEKAHQRIKSFVHKTRLEKSKTINEMIHPNISLFFKCENSQKMGAFKIRGAYNCLKLLETAPVKNSSPVSNVPNISIPHGKPFSVITHSSGNHAQALALAGKTLNIPVTVIMPSNSPKVKSDAVQNTYSAKVVFCEPTIVARTTKTVQVVEKTGSLFIHPFNDYRIIHGAGTACYEMLKFQLPDCEIVFCPIGGGGLMSGTAIAAKGIAKKNKKKIVVIGVEPEKANDAWKSFTTHTLCPPIDPPQTFADGLRTGLGPITFDCITKYVDHIITVSEEEILSALKLLFLRMKLVVEPSGAVSLAGVFKAPKMFPQYFTKPVECGAIISGGNLDLSSLFDSFPIK